MTTTQQSKPENKAPAIPAQRPKVGGPGTIRKLLEQNQSAIEAALPRHVTPERLIGIATSAVRITPKLVECDAATMLGAVVQASILGLEPNTGLSECWLLPFYNKKSRLLEVQLIIGYRGKIKLAENTGNLLGLNAKLVHEKDEFEFVDGIVPQVRHKYHHLDDRGAVYGYWAGVALKSGFMKVDFARRKEMLEHMERFAMTRNENGVFGVWKDHFDSMALKTMVHRVMNLVPKSAEARWGWTLDARADAGMPQQFDPRIPEALQPTPDDDAVIEVPPEIEEPRRVSNGQPQQENL